MKIDFFEDGKKYVIFKNEKLASKSKNLSESLIQRNPLKSEGKKAETMKKFVKFVTKKLVKLKKKKGNCEGKNYINERNFISRNTKMKSGLMTELEKKTMMIA